MPQGVLQAVVFDLGGVLIQLDHARLGLPVDRETWHRWLLEHPVARAWETGQCAFSDFAEAVCGHFQPGLSPQDLAQMLQDWVQTRAWRRRLWWPSCAQICWPSA